ncbi:hypothetical protein [Streptomyces sp. NPDC058475]|uniref:hypothetical protein n=1 Tax=unclassified Streptomyces TaxID=2593676 RepID=UPI00364A4F77
MEMAAKVDALMEGLRADLERLAAMASVTFPGLPVEPVPADLRHGGGEHMVDLRADADDGVRPGGAG